MKKIVLFIILAFAVQGAVVAQVNLKRIGNQIKRSAEQQVEQKIKEKVSEKTVETETTTTGQAETEAEEVTTSEQSEVTQEAESETPQPVSTETEQEPDDRPAPTGDKLKDKYNGLFYNIKKANEATDITKKHEFYQLAATMRSFFTWRGDFSKDDERFAELTNALIPLYNELKPHNFERLEPVKTFDEIRGEKFDEIDKEYGVDFRYYGDDAASLKSLAEKEFRAKMSGTYDIIYSDFKHGWIVNEERSGQQVVAHIKRLRYVIIYHKNGNYYAAEALFSQRAPILGSYTPVDWPSVGFYGDPIPADYISNRLLKKTGK
ncbi:MAG: hypothetical protein QM305_04140 [Bacteroidota bacterium]|jgi:DNA mismatch repair ATPase MutL|nr:hypothetical protein [Bacteroidota bacterium]